MRPNSWADRLLALLVRFVGLVILLATLAAATASYFYNQAEEADRAERVAAQINMRLRDHVAVLEGVRALYQSDISASGPGIRAYLAALQPQIHAPGMEGVGIAAAMRAGTPAAIEAKLRENYGRDIKVWPATDQPVGFAITLVEPYTPRRDAALGFDMFSEPTRRAAMRRAWQTGQPAASGIVHLSDLSSRLCPDRKRREPPDHRHRQRCPPGRGICLCPVPHRRHGARRPRATARRD